MRKGGEEEARSVQGMCDVFAVHCDKSAVGVDVDEQGSSLCEDGWNIQKRPKLQIMEAHLREHPLDALQMDVKGKSSRISPRQARARAGQATKPNKWPRAKTLMLETLPEWQSAQAVGSCTL